MPAQSFPTLPILAAAVLAATHLAACGPAGSERFDANLGTSADELVAENGLSLNGLSANGLSANGLSANGLSANGLSTKSLGTSAFKNWFNGNVTLSDMAMRYLVHCAAPATKTITWKNPVTGITYNWPGGIGVAPNYANGTKPTLDEQQLITACVLAHVNKWGKNVSISVDGRTATGAEIPWTQTEISTFASIEAAYFGNMFDPNDGVYVCDHWASQQSRSYSSWRVCSWPYWPAKPGDGCAPIQQLGICMQAGGGVCQIDTANWVYYKSCTLNGKTYKPITVLTKHSDTNVCGDGICQATEKCGTGTDFDNCSDCGPCP